MGRMPRRTNAPRTKAPGTKAPVTKPPQTQFIAHPLVFIRNYIF